MRRLIGLMIVVLALLLTACGGSVEDTPYPSEVDWETAVALLSTGEVVAVFQTHSLDVTLEMADGSQIKTVEPMIDAIFEEIDACGQPCSGILLATE